MKGSAEVIETLRFGIMAERHLNLQYRADGRLVKFIGAKKTAKKLKSFGDDCHSYLKCLEDRCLFLGWKIVGPIADITETDSLTESFKNELALEMAIVGPYEKAIQIAMQAFDDATRNLFEHLIKWHQQAIAWLECQLRLIEAITEPEYIAEKL